MDVASVKAALNERAEDVCRKLLPGGKKEGHEWKAADLNGVAGHSLGIVIEGSKVGVWKEFAGNMEGGSNLLELWIQVRNSDFKTALAEAKLFLGVRDDAPVKSVKPKQYEKPNRAGIVAAKGPVVEYLTKERGLTEATINLYRISQTDDGKEIVFPFLTEAEKPLPEMFKFLALERDERGKKVVRTSAKSRKGLFGKNTARGNDRRLLISEGEIDAMTWRQATDILATSVPFGAKWEGENGSDPNLEWIENDWEFLERFEEIYLAFDMDEEGKKARESISRRLGRERCFVIDTPKKDGNETLLKCGVDAMKDALAAARTLDPAELKNAASFFENVRDLFFDKGKPAATGIPLPLATKGGQFHLRMGELTIISGFNGHGKTMWLNFLVVHLVVSLQKRCMIGSFEVPVGQTLRYLYSQASGQDRPESEDELMDCVNALGSGLWFYNVVGQVDRKTLLESMRYAFMRYGITFFVIDSLMKCGLEKDDFNGQKKFMDELTIFLNQYPCHVFLVAHSRKKQDEKEPPGKLDVEGAAEITGMAHNVFAVWRNKKKEAQLRDYRLDGSPKAQLQIAQITANDYDALAVCLKQKNGDGTEPEIEMWFHRESRQFTNEHRDTSERTIVQTEF